MAPHNHARDIGQGNERDVDESRDTGTGPDDDPGSEDLSEDADEFLEQWRDDDKILDVVSNCTLYKFTHPGQVIYQ